MNTPTPPDADPTPDHEERELSALYRQLPAAEPDEALDARVLDAARRAVTRNPRRRYRALLVGFASMSSLVMAAGLTWHLYANGPGKQRDVPAHGVSGTSQADVAKASSQVVRVRILSADDAPASHHALKQMAGSSDTSASALSVPGRTAQSTPAAPTAGEDVRPATNDKTLVVPVRILSERQGERAASRIEPSTKLLGGFTGKERIHASAKSAASKPSGKHVHVQALIDKARRALANGDEARARRLVQQLVRSYPQQPLPADLSRLGTSEDAPGSP